MLNFQDVLLKNYPEFVQKHRKSALVAGKLLATLFHQSRFEAFDEEHPGVRGFEFIEAALTFFDFDIRVRENERARIPTSGRVVIAANHPIGSLDGLALLHLIRQVRPDVKVVANSLLMEVEALHDIMLPVDNMGGKTARQNVLALREHLESDAALLIFPAGEVSRLGSKGIRDGLWHSGFVKIASATKSPILPVFVRGRNSAFFYGLSLFAKPLSTAWLIREMFKQRRKTMDVRIGRAIPHDVYSANGFAAKTLAAMFKKHVYRLAKGRKPLFRSVETVAPPESKVLLRQELMLCDELGVTPDGKRMLLTVADRTPCLMREIGRLREMTFRLVGEGTGLPRDIDRFDRDYYQLFLWDDEDLEIVGAYRLGDARELVRQSGTDGLYTSTLFEFDDSASQYFKHGLELGRSFVQPRYQTRQALDYLWFAIGAFVKQHPHIRYLFGPASISRFYSDEAISRLAFYYSNNFGSLPVGVTPKNPFIISETLRATLVQEFSGLDRDEDFRSLRDALKESGLSVPTLYKHYAQVTDHHGVTFTAFNKDPEFGDCVDGFVIADLTRLKPKKKRRYLGEDWTHVGD